MNRRHRRVHWKAALLNCLSCYVSSSCGLDFEEGLPSGMRSASFRGAVQDHRILLDLSEYSDPKDEFSKDYLLPFPANEFGEHNRPLNILALGGSVTWGATLDNREDAYPWLLAGPFTQHVDNMSMRATGADYPSLCLQSIIPRQDESRASYDLILLDFVQNGTDGFPLLLRRLRQRYPDAVIVFIKLWSVLTFAVEEGTGKVVLEAGKDPTRSWVWKDGDVFNRGYKGDEHGCGREICDVHQMEELIREQGGYAFELPRPASPKTVLDEGWFAEEDWHHLSKKGHEILAKSLADFLITKKDELFRDDKRIGTWGEGDQCYNWFMSGVNPLTYSGGEMVNILKDYTADGEKWVLTMRAHEMVVEFDSKYDHPVPLGIGYMSRQDPASYPIVQFTINDANPSIVDPNVNRETVQKSVHITAFSHVGMAVPGHNVLRVTTIDQRTDPFRMVGIYLCGVCAASGNLGSGAINFKQLG